MSLDRPAPPEPDQAPLRHPVAPEVAVTTDNSDESAVKRGRRRRRFSFLTARIFLPNVLALAILVGGILFLDQYQDRLLNARIDALRIQADLIGGALGEAALRPPDAAGEEPANRLDGAKAEQIVRRLVAPTQLRARLFAVDGTLLADSRELISAGRTVQSKDLPPPDDPAYGFSLIEYVYDWVLPRLPHSGRFQPYRERLTQSATDYDEAIAALSGDTATRVRVTEDRALLISVAVPVQQLRRVHGALLVSTDGSDIDQAVREVRIAILQVFAVSLGITFLLSVYLAGTIGRPVRKLAQAAEQVRVLGGQRVPIPIFQGRRDEIADLSHSLSDMTHSLYERIDAIERFAADVSHELKNPLTSVRSAVETLARTEDPERKQRLIRIIENDVRRLDRLITDISNASRVESELTRSDFEQVDLAGLLSTSVDIYRNRRLPRQVDFTLQISPETKTLRVAGVPGRLGQVVDNLLSNAVSFSPEGGTVQVALRTAGDGAEIVVSDQGRGLPLERVDRIFQRFYSDRPSDEAFGHHSGLGLSICRQIVAGHRGRISAANRLTPEGHICGAEFVVWLPV